MHRRFMPIGLVLLLAACGQSGSNLGSTGSREILRINTTSLPAAYANEPYTASVQVQGGVNPYTLRVTSGTLPPGLRLNGTRLEGTPTTTGRFEFILEASDASLSTKAQNYAVTVGTLPPLNITPTFPSGEFRADTRVPVRIEYPRSTTAARLQWQLPEGVQVSNIESAQGGQMLLWKQTGNLLTMDVGFVKAPATGSNIALIGLKFASPTRLDAAKRAFTAVDATGKLVAQKTFTETVSSNCTPVRATATPATGATGNVTPPATSTTTPATENNPATPATTAPGTTGSAGTPPAAATTEGTRTQGGAGQDSTTGTPSGTPAAAPASNSPGTTPQAPQNATPTVTPAQDAAAKEPADTTGVIRPTCAPAENAPAPANSPSSPNTAPGSSPSPASPNRTPTAPGTQPQRETPVTTPREETTPTAPESTPNEPAGDTEGEDPGTPSVPTIPDPTPPDGGEGQ